MLLLKLANACFIDSPENVDISQTTNEFVLQYVFNCASQAELDHILVSKPVRFKDKDIDKLPKSVQKAVREGVRNRRIEI